MTDGRHLDSRFHCSPHGLSGKSRRLSLSHRVFLHLETCHWEDTPTPPTPWGSSVPSVGKLPLPLAHMCHMCVASRPFMLESWPSWGSRVPFNGNSMVLMTHLPPPIWIFTAQQAWRESCCRRAERAELPNRAWLGPFEGTIYNGHHV